VREVALAVVNISVQGGVRKDNPLEVLGAPKQVEKEANATGSGLIVYAGSAPPYGVKRRMHFEIAKLSRPVTLLT
jgi:hypothetical protein